MIVVMMIIVMVIKMMRIDVAIAWMIDVAVVTVTSITIMLLKMTTIMMIESKKKLVIGRGPSRLPCLSNSPAGIRICIHLCFERSQVTGQLEHDARANPEE